jgi:hypothetical protein
MPAERFLVGMYQLHLPRRGGGLKVFEPGATFVDPQHVAAYGNRTRGNNQYLMTIPVQHRNIVGESLKPATMNMAVIADEYRGTHLYDQAAAILEFET